MNGAPQHTPPVDAQLFHPDGSQAPVLHWHWAGYDDQHTPCWVTFTADKEVCALNVAAAGDDCRLLVVHAG